MKKIDNKWVDKNNNSWNCDFYSKEKAIELSNTLINCSDCSYCSDCLRCLDCSRCSDCSYCSDFNDNPQRITSHKIGSRNSQTTIYWTNEKQLIVCGCFKGTMQEFKDKIKETHDNNEYAVQYNEWIAKVEQYIN